MNHHDRNPRQLEDVNGPAQWYESLPFVTRHWFSSAVLTTFFVNMGIIPIDKVYFSYELLTENFEIWRVLSNFFWIGPFKLGTLFNLFMLYRYSISYETMTGFNTGGGGGTADYIFMLLFGAVGILASGILFDLGPFYSQALIDYVMYIWCRRDPTGMVNIWGIPLQAMYLPFVILALQLFMGNPYVLMIQAFVVGHTYYFLVEIVPKMYAKMYLQTPEILISCFGIGEYQPPRPANGMEGIGPTTQASSQGRTAQNNNGGGRYDWGGGGQRLGR